MTFYTYASLLKVHNFLLVLSQQMVMFEKSYPVHPLLKVTLSARHEPTDQLNKVLVDLQRLAPDHDQDDVILRHHKTTTMLKMNRKYVKLTVTTSSNDVITRVLVHKIPVRQIVCCATTAAQVHNLFAFVSPTTSHGPHQQDQQGRLVCFVMRVPGPPGRAQQVQDALQRLDPGLGPELGGFSREEVFGCPGDQQQANCVMRPIKDHTCGKIPCPATS